MALQRYFNDPGTTLGAAITSTTATSITVASSTGYPSGGNFQISIGSELMLVTAVSGTTWTVTRGVEGTTAATHLISTAVNAFFTAGTIDGIRGLISQTGLYSAIPGAPKAGDMYWPSDSRYAFRFNGTIWEAWGPLQKFTPNDGSAFAFTNGHSSSATFSGGVLTLTWVPTGSTEYGLYDAPIPTAPYDVRFCVEFGGSQSFGIHLADSSTGKFEMLFVAIGSNGGQALWLYDFNSPTSFNAAILQNLAFAPRAKMWFRVTDDNAGNRSWWFSVDGRTANFTLVKTLSSSAFMSPNRVGMMSYLGDTTFPGNNFTHVYSVEGF